MAENFRAWFARTRGAEYPGYTGEGGVVPRALEAVADWADELAQRAAAAPQQPLPEVQVCRVENHITAGRGSDLRVIADDPDAPGDENLRRWVESRLSGIPRRDPAP